MSFGVSDGIGSGTPGRLTPLWALTEPPTTTVQRALPRLDLLDPQADEAVVDQHVVARREHVADHRRRDGQLAVVGRSLRRR